MIPEDMSVEQYKRLAEERRQHFLTLPLWKRFLIRRRAALTLGWRSVRLLVTEWMRGDKNYRPRLRQIKVCIRAFFIGGNS